MQDTRTYKAGTIKPPPNIIKLTILNPYMDINYSSYWFSSMGKYHVNFFDFESLISKACLNIL